MITQCQSCGARSTVPDSAIGRTVKCPQCATLFTVAAAPYVEPQAPLRLAPPRSDAGFAEDSPRPRRPPMREQPRGSMLGLLGFLMGGLALVVALAALGLTWFRDPLGGGMRKYNFSTPKDSMMSQIKMMNDGDIRAMMDMTKLTTGKKAEEKLRTLDVKKEAEWSGKKVVFYTYEDDGKRRNQVEFFEKDANTGYWLHNFDSYRWRDDIRRDNPELSGWIESFPANGTFREFKKDVERKDFKEDFRKDFKEDFKDKK